MGLLPLLRVALSLSSLSDTSPLFLHQLYHNMLEQTGCGYANTSASKAVSAQQTQESSKAANEYNECSPAHSAAGCKEQTGEPEEEKLLQPSEAQ